MKHGESRLTGIPASGAAKIALEREGAPDPNYPRRGPARIGRRQADSVIFSLGV
jgi:hypothetical protein